MDYRSRRRLGGVPNGAPSPRCQRPDCFGRPQASLRPPNSNCLVARPFKSKIEPAIIVPNRARPVEKLPELLSVGVGPCKKYRIAASSPGPFLSGAGALENAQIPHPYP